MYLKDLIFGQYLMMSIFQVVEKACSEIAELGEPRFLISLPESIQSENLNLTVYKEIIKYSGVGTQKYNQQASTWSERS